jgi:RNA 2',3'-cyclic 3'-phosphodiesterase
MPDSIRSFLAFDIENNTVLNRLTATQKRLVQTGADMKLVESQNIHITMRFLGNIKSATAEKVLEEMKQIQFVPFNVQIKGVGAFPNPNYARVVWVGITKGTDQLKDLFDQLEPRLRGLGFTPDLKGFSPHLTIARVRSGKNKQQLSKFITENTNHEFGAVKARCLRLKKSDLTPRGPVYSTLKEFCP